MASTSCTCLIMILILITSYHKMQAQLHCSLNNAPVSIQFFLPMKTIIQLQLSCNADTIVSYLPCNTQSLMKLWHSRLVLNKVLSQLNIDVSSYVAVKFFDACQYGKPHQDSFPPTLLHTTTPFQIIHSEVWGLAPFLSIDGYRYYISFVDDYRRYTWIFPLQLKSKATSMFVYFNTMIDSKVKCLQTDWEGGS